MKVQPLGSSANVDSVEVEGLKVAYHRVGHGPFVVLMHGFVGDAASTWGHQINALASDYTVLAPDLPGAGHSSDPTEGFTAADYSDCLTAFLRELGFKRSHVVGLSFGGVIALSLAARHPTLPRSLALLGAYAGWRGSLAAADVEARLAACLRFSKLPPEEFAAAMLPSMFSPQASPKAVAAFGASVARFSPNGFCTMARASAEADLTAELVDIDVPALLLYGDHDLRAPVAVGRQLQAGLRSAQLEVLPGVGHVSPVEAPGEVSRHLREFLGSVT
jgi:pimeloyl-ACP methyl ester carboxylesterase